MPAVPYAKILVSVSAGAPTSGKVVCAFGASVQLSGENTTGWASQRWEIYDYPVGFSAPAGWSTDSAGVIFNTAVTPPVFSIGASSNNNWGKFSLRLTVNNNPTRIDGTGAVNSKFNVTLTDTSTILDVRSPQGQEGIGFGESTQGDALRSWAGTLMRNARILEPLLGGGGGSLAGDVTGTAGANTVVNLTGSAGVVTVTSGTVLAMGTSPASAGLIRMPNATVGLAFHDNAAGYIAAISVDSANDLIVGADTGFAHNPQSIQLCAVSSGTVAFVFNGNTAIAVTRGLSTLLQFYEAGLPALVQMRTQTSDAAVNDLTLQAQSAFATAATNINGAFTAVQGGAAKTNGSSGRRGGVRLQVGADSAETLVEVTEPVLGNRVVALCQIGSGISSTQMPANTGDGVVYLANRAIVPSANAVGGGILYAEAGALKWRGSGGTVTTVANA